MRARSVVVVSLFVAVAAPAACHSGNGSGCPTSSCKISALTYQTCQSSDGTVTYSFAGQSCSCPPSEAEQCSECDGNLQLYCEGVSGAINASMTCEVTLTYTTLTKRADLTISVPQPMPLQAVSIEIGQPGEPMTGTWTGADTGATASISAVDSINSMNESWACQVSGGTSVGEYTLDLTVGKGQITSSGESFGANGTLTATLLPQSATDAMGDVKVQVSF
jgi:hypothetical protein